MQQILMRKKNNSKSTQSNEIHLLFIWFIRNSPYFTFSSFRQNENCFWIYFVRSNSDCDLMRINPVHLISQQKYDLSWNMCRFTLLFIIYIIIKKRFPILDITFKTTRLKSKISKFSRFQKLKKKLQGIFTDIFSSNSIVSSYIM